MRTLPRREGAAGPSAGIRGTPRGGWGRGSGRTRPGLPGAVHPANARTTASGIIISSLAKSQAQAPRKGQMKRDFSQAVSRGRISASQAELELKSGWGEEEGLPPAFWAVPTLAPP